ncbi:peroxiredoxin [Deinococcus peraridilitoris]|uniref:thioredoxin-dependent peroxiredoxin n=1 Tax=Deinococcus peraridilitoris (strain DSM 19664 / LMG 22246 / CIP 109416 / KR-200) TaxID=937777 RepID=K9ZWA8_DEIPD|nr:peroxiredoxin [Deinococcus peraridilitoris]AFZ65861.1 Peroxiredoxin [Deinococcus peraridilitoris DSM 19664]
MTQEAALQAGQPFPDFALPDADNHLHRLADYRGRYLVLYVYPKDDTPGCTKEACDFRDHAELRAEGAAILGLSRDDAESHAGFAQKFSLNFPLVSDPDATFIRTIGAWGTKNLYGKVSEGLKRSTFLIAPDGTLVKVWSNVKVDGHADAVLRELREHKARRG